MLTIRNALRVTGRARTLTTLLFAASLLAAAGGIAFAVIVLRDDPAGVTPSSASSATPESAHSAVATASGPSPTATPIATATPTPTVPTGPPPSLEEAHRLLREGDYAPAAEAFRLAGTKSAGAERAAALVGEANALAEDGDAMGALAALRNAVTVAPAGSAEAVRARYLLGRRLLADNDPEGARAALEPVAPAVSSLAPYVVLELGNALTETADPAGAAAAYERAANSNAPTALRVTALRALSALATSPAAKLAALQRERAVRETGALLAAIATAQAETGDPAAADATLRVLAARYPSSLAALEAVRKLRLTGGALDAGEEGIVFYRHGRLADARRVLEAAVAESGISPEALGERWYFLGATYEDLGLGAQAVAAYDRAATTASAAFVHRARYWAARVTEGLDDAPGASARYRGVVGGGPGEFVSESAFRAGFVLLDSGDAPGAIAAWAETGAAGGARTLYWKGRALTAIGRTAEANVAWDEAKRLDPVGLYGNEAARELGLAGLPGTGYRPLPTNTTVDWPAVERWLISVAGERGPLLDTSVAAELAAAGLHAEAEDALLEAGTSGWTMFDAMRAARALGLPSVGVQLAFRLSARYADTQGVLTRLEYPIGFAQTLDAEAKARNLDPLFLAALIRQESLWDEKAGSTAGALGLTQVIPPTGEAIAKALGVTVFRAEDLFRPSVALRFGAYYIAGQLSTYGTPWAALSAYNAGPGAADRWRRAATRNTAADYIEVVDYSETHSYVALVLDHYGRYLAAYR